MSTYDLPQQVQIQLQDKSQGLTHFSANITYVFEDEPMPLGSDDGALTVVVNMASDECRPEKVRSLTSTFMVSDYEWNISEEPEKTAAILLIKGVSLESQPISTNLPAKADTPASRQQLFSNIQRDAHNLAKRVALVSQSLDNLDNFESQDSE
ncbi:hypothetical protein LPJ66_007456 [Kickxella alabastrina]|uniref:Uncharacterized protein n=1 Tax=Kickxella alabastrina TaxID=61397 RepID=A0ACC1I8V7_9FUNG|nr:hypothetical protein LPJ66_007456 [Kickxella alabastrina]